MGSTLSPLVIQSDIAIPNLRGGGNLACGWSPYAVVAFSYKTSEPDEECEIHCEEVAEGSKNPE